jgi:hypothetical protein
MVKSRYRAVLCRYTGGVSLPDVPADEPIPIDVTIPGSREDPRDEPPPPEGVRIHRVPSLHPEDVVTLPNGLRVTSLARTLIDLAECIPRDELCEVFATARERGLLDMEGLRRARARVEWRPSLAMLDSVIAEFDD